MRPCSNGSRQGCYPVGCTESPSRPAAMPGVMVVCPPRLSKVGWLRTVRASEKSLCTAIRSPRRNVRLLFTLGGCPCVLHAAAAEQAWSSGLSLFLACLWVGVSSCRCRVHLPRSFSWPAAHRSSAHGAHPISTGCRTAWLARLHILWGLGASAPRVLSLASLFFAPLCVEQPVSLPGPALRA